MVASFGITRDGNRFSSTGKSSRLRKINRRTSLGRFIRSVGGFEEEELDCSTGVFESTVSARGITAVTRGTLIVDSVDCKVLGLMSVSW